MMKAMLFDCDGVLIDSTCLGIELIRKIAGGFGLAIPSFDDVRAVWGEALSVVINSLAADLGWSAENGERLKKLFIKLEAAIVYNKVAGVDSFIKTFGGKIPLGVISNRWQAYLESVLRMCGVDTTCFQLIQGGMDGQPRKPDPRVFDRALEFFGVESDQVIFVGDTKIDCLAATGCDPAMPFIPISTGAVLPVEWPSIIGNGFKERDVLLSLEKLPGVLENKGLKLT